MKTMINILILAFAIPNLVTAKGPEPLVTAETIQVIKISSQDERAIIKTPDGKMQIIKPGDSLGANGKVTEIAADRIVIEEKKGSETEKVIIRLSDEKQKVERMKKTGDKPMVLFAPPEKDKKIQGNKKGSSDD